jgi:hypothetical protein
VARRAKPAPVEVLYSGRDMLGIVLLATLLAVQVRTPETLRPPATPPHEGTGKFREYSYAFHQDSTYFVIEFTPTLSSKQAVVLDAMKSVCRDLYDLDFRKAETVPGPGTNVWRFELNDLRTCYGRQMPGAKGEITSLRIWMP